MRSFRHVCITFILMGIALHILPAALHGQPATALLQQGVEWGILHQYDQALALFDTLSRSYPDHPEGPFYHAAIYQSMMLDYESGEWSALFYQCLEESIRRAKEQLRIHPEDAGAQFYTGAAYAYKSAQLSRDGKYWPAYRAIQSSLDYLEPLVRRDSTFCDALLGIGTYHYWRSRITLNLSWLPFFPDRRSEGIADITRASECAQISPASAWSNLSWIYIREKEFDRAILYARMGLERYPGSRFFLWPLAEAQFQQADYPAAISSFSELLLRTRETRHTNGYNELVILWKLAQCHASIGQNDFALNYYQQVLDCPVSADVEKRAEDKKKKAKQWLEKQEERLKKQQRIQE